MATKTLTGVVLAGGQSRRMGRDKASLPWGDSDLLHTVLVALAPVCGRLIVVSNIPRVIRLPGVDVVADLYPGCGPLAGIHAGLTAAGDGYSFVTACDMPHIDGSAAAWLAAAAEDYDAAVPRIDGHYNPLHAVYHRRCLPVAGAMLAAGRHRAADLFAAVRTREVTAAELAVFDPGLGMLRNLNTPEDLEPFECK